MSRSFSSVVVALVAFVTLSSSAFGAWSEILSLNVPMNGTFPTTNLIRTSRMKLIKTGQDCPRVRTNFTALGRDLSGQLVLTLGLNAIGQDSYGNSVYQVNPFATIYDFVLQTTAGGRNADCTYTFYAETLD